MKGRLLRVALLLFGSGMTALIYQVAWMRELRLIFGFSTAASAAVLAIFMGGLGLGGWLLGRRADAAGNPLAFYGRLELAVAGSAALTPLWVWLVREGYIASGGTLRLGLFGGTLVRLIFSAAVLCVPTVLMGGTLPAATRAVETDKDARRRFLALLYGSNSLGAVAGTLLSTFLLLESLGTRMTLWLACAVNALVGLLAVRLSGASADAGERNPPPKEKPKEKPKKGEAAAVAPSGALAHRRFVLGAAGVVGFAFFLMELVWYRMLAPLLGGSTYTFGLILAVALAGIGAGSAAYWFFARGRTATLSGFAATCALEALCLAVPYALGDSVAILAGQMAPKGAFGFAGYVAGWSLVAAIVVFPAALVAGLQFPLLIALLGKGRERVGSDVGNAYAWNTVGGIAGSLAGGFGLLPLLSATGSWVFVVGLLCALGLFALLFSLRAGGSGRRRGVWLPIGAAAASLLLLIAPGPTAAWRHSAIGSGRQDFRRLSSNALRGWVRDRRRQLVWQADGLESSVALLKKELGYAFAIAGKVDGSARGDAGTQVMGGLIGAALHPDPHRALVIGLGTGETAGWSAAVPGIERVDVVELEPVVLRVARDCAPANLNVLSNPKVRIAIGDAREYLLTSRETYDFIFSEPSNPFRAGISSLFTEDFYRAVRARLGRKGIFLQWLQTYEVDRGTVQTVYATLSAVFPEVETWYTLSGDLLLVATAEPIAYNSARLSERLRQEPFASAMENVWRVAGLEGFLSHYVAQGSFARASAAEGGAARNTDDRNIIEFAFARSLGHRVSFDIAEVRRVTRARGQDRPPVSGQVDWRAVDRWRVARATSEGTAPAADDGLTAEELQQALAQKSFIQGRRDLVLGDWRLRPWEPVGSVEELVLADALAEGGDDRAEDYIARLRGSHPVEADLLLGRLRWRQGRSPEAVEALVRAFIRCREDPWPMPIVVQKAFPVALDLAASNDRFAVALFDALASPFSVAVLDDERHVTLLGVASRVDAARYARVLREMEPNVPWQWGILKLRARAYEETGDPLAALARRELNEFEKKRD
jgi:spermidine synthase